MKIVEYKRHLVNGVVSDPEFIVEGGMFYNPTDRTWVGLVLDEADRPYYVPDTLVELTVSDLKARVRNLNMQKLSNLNDPHSASVSLTDAECDHMVDELITNRTI